MENARTTIPPTTPSRRSALAPRLQIARVTRRDAGKPRAASRPSSRARTVNYTRRQTHFVIVKDVTGFNSAVCRCSSDRDRTEDDRDKGASRGLAGHRAVVASRGFERGGGGVLLLSLCARADVCVCCPGYNNGVLR